MNTGHSFAIRPSSTAKKTIWVVRHAQSNRQIGLQKDTCDCDLSPEGFRQASTLAGRLAGIRPDVIIVSVMRRAQQTFLGAKITAPRMEVDSRAIEEGTYPELAGIRPPLSPLLRPDVHDDAPAVAAAVVEVCGSEGYNWFDLA